MTTPALSTADAFAHKSAHYQAREAVKDITSGGLHDLRAAYACERYESLSGHPAPVTGGVIVDRESDSQARKKIAVELGHGRIDVVGEYVGGRRP